MNGAADARARSRADLGMPFAVAALLAVPLAALPPERAGRFTFVALGAGLTLGAIALAAGTQWRGRRAGTLAPALVLLLAIAALRHAEGGSGSGYSLVLVVPLLWVAVHGARGELGAFLVASAVVLVVPILGLGAPDYPVREWRRVALWLAVGPLVGFTVQLLVGRARGRASGETRAREVADAILDTAAALIVVLDPAGRITRFNRACERVAGYAEEEVLGERFDARLVPADAARGVQDALARVREDDEPVTHENEWTTRDGERRLIVWSNAAVFDAAGELTHVVASGIDVTDVRRAERARQEAQARFCAAFEHAPIGVALVGAAPPWRFEDANPALCRLLGAPRDVLLGRPVADIVESGEVSAATSVLGQAEGDGGRRSSTELRLRGADGAELWVQVSAARTPVLAGDAQLVVHFQDVTERRRHDAQLRDLADHDPLTGLLNRRRFAEELDEAIRLSQRYGEPAALLTLDLDGFKAVNDRHGHAAGDELLRRVALAMRERLRDSDVIARLGGDEFAVLLPRIGGPAAATVAGELLRHLGRTAKITRDGVEVQASASVGVASVDPAGAASREELLVDADVAMYEAKAAGRNQTVLARSPVPGPRISEPV